jgi:hypothetical protein
MHNSELRFSSWMQLGLSAGPAKLVLKKHFYIGSASDEIISAYAQPAMKSFPPMLSKQ